MDGSSLTGNHATQKAESSAFFVLKEPIREDCVSQPEVNLISSESASWCSWFLKNFPSLTFTRSLSKI